MMEQITDITECCICAEMFTDPRMLPCIHTFCLKCIEATRLKSVANQGDTMPCPLCRQQFTIPPDGVNGLQKNFFMERLMEIAKISKPLKTAMLCDVCLANKGDGDIEVQDASKYCVECRENMCEVCSVQHKRQKLSRDHQLVPVGSQLKDELVKTFVATFCSQHSKEELKMYCADCKKVICMMCFAESHQLHKCSDVNKVADGFRDEIGLFLAKVENCSVERWERKLQLEKETKTFIEELQIAETAIKDRANELKQLIDQHAKVLLDELVQKKSTRMKETENKNEEIEGYLAMVNSFSSYCSEIKSKGTPTDICRSVHDLRARANELQKVNVKQIKQDTFAGHVHVSFKTFAMEDVMKMENIVGSLKVVDQHKLLAKPNTKNEKPVENVGRLQCPKDVLAVTKLDDKIYVLCISRLLGSSGSGSSICIFEVLNPFQVYKNIEISEICVRKYAVSSEELKCMYIYDSWQSYIWKLTADDCRVTQWLSIVGGLFCLSVSNEGHLLQLRDDKGVSQLEIYGSEAKIIQSIALSSDLMSPLHVVQEYNGQFIIIYKSVDSKRRSWVISELSSGGQILRQLQSEEKCQEFMIPYHLCLDSENDRLFVAQENQFNSSVVMLDLSSLEWKQILQTSKDRLSIHYDECNKRLLVGKVKEVAVYQIY